MISSDYDNSLADVILISAKLLLNYYLRIKYQFLNIEFWGEEPFHMWDDKISDLRNIITEYSLKGKHKT